MGQNIPKHLSSHLLSHESSQSHDHRAVSPEQETQTKAEIPIPGNLPASTGWQDISQVSDQP